MPDSTQNSGPAHFQGLSPRAKLGIVVSAIVLSGASLGAGWVQAASVGRHIPLNREDLSIVNEYAVRTGGAPDPALAAVALSAQVHIKTITNHQAIASLGIGCGFALISIGFALFLLGADGAFQLQYEGKGDSKLVFYGTAPGLLCFLLATVLLVVSMTREYTITTGMPGVAPGGAASSGAPPEKNVEEWKKINGIKD